MATTSRVRITQDRERRAPVKTAEQKQQRKAERLLLKSLKTCHPAWVKAGIAKSPR
jgi:hypothetical protein